MLHKFSGFFRHKSLIQHWNALFSTNKASMMCRSHLFRYFCKKKFWFKLCICGCHCDIISRCFLFKEKNIRSKLGHDGILLLHQLTHLNNTCGFTSYRRQFPQKDIWQLMKICCDCVTFKTLVMITYWIRLKSWILTWHICGYLPLIEEVD